MLSHSAAFGIVYAPRCQSDALAVLNSKHDAFYIISQCNIDTLF